MPALVLTGQQNRLLISPDFFLEIVSDLKTEAKKEAEEAKARQDEGHYHCQLKPYSIEHRIQSFLATFWLIYFLGCGRGDISYLLSLLAREEAEARRQFIL